MRSGNQLPLIPDQVKSLNEGEERLVAPRAMFMQMRKLGCDRQRGIKSNVINVPIDIGKIYNYHVPHWITKSCNCIFLKIDMKSKHLKIFLQIWRSHLRGVPHVCPA